MRTPRVLIPAPCGPSRELELPPEEARHLIRVLRRGVGDAVILVAPSGEPQEAEIVRVESRGASVVVIVHAREVAAGIPASRTTPWTVAVGVPKGDALEAGLRGAAELGLEALVPLVTDRTIPRLDACVRKLDRWRRIARESAKQCGRPNPLAVLEPTTFQELVDSCGARGATWGRCFVLDPTASGTLASVVAALREPAAGEPAGGLRRATFLVGPEGGFTPEEVTRAAEGGFRPVHLPVPVLRTPTALTLVGALGVLLGEVGPWLSGARAPSDTPEQGQDGFSR